MHKKNQDTYTAVILKGKCITLQINGLRTQTILKEKKNKKQKNTSRLVLAIFLI